MLQRHSPTIDELLGDSLIQAVMRADNVEPQALRSLLAGAAERIAVGREGELRPTSALFAKPPIDRRATPRAANGPMRPRPALPADPCGWTLCCS